MSTELVISEILAGGLAVLTLNRPDQRNALNTPLLLQLRRCLHSLAPQPLHALILTGAGSAFSSGADLRERLQMTPGERTRHTHQIAAAAQDLVEFPAPVVGAIDGVCLGGGAELALGCDMLVATPQSVLGFPEVTRGIFPGAGAPIRLTERLGRGMARRLLFTGESLTAQQALEVGLIQGMDPDALESARNWALQMAQASPRAVRALKAGLNAWEKTWEKSAISVLQSYREELDEGADYAEGLKAFTEKRRPNFSPP